MTIRIDRIHAPFSSIAASCVARSVMRAPAERAGH